MLTRKQLKYITAVLSPILDKLGIDCAIFQEKLSEAMRVIDNIDHDELFKHSPKEGQENLLHYIHQVICQQLKEQEELFLKQVIKETKVKTLTHESLRLALENRPQESYVHQKISAQIKLFDRLRELGGDIPLGRVWQFVIDGRAHDQGAYAFENEAGYILAALKGLHFALADITKKPDAEWLKSLHGMFTHDVAVNLRRIEGLCFELSLPQRRMVFEANASIASLSFFQRSLSIQRFSEGFRHVQSCNYGGLVVKADEFEEIIEPELLRRKNWLSYSVTPDPTQRDCLKIRLHFYKHTDNTFITRKVIMARINELFENFELFVHNARNDVERLLACIYIFREITLHHPFMDGNLRTSLANFNRVLLQQGFPMVIFENPNKHDLKMPRAFCCAVIDAMQTDEAYKDRLYEAVDKCLEPNLTWIAFENAHQYRPECDTSSASMTRASP
jgi:6-pyruvoyl-tetrahydropterin synthase